MYDLMGVWRLTTCQTHPQRWLAEGSHRQHCFVYGSGNHQAASIKHQAASVKDQASSSGITHQASSIEYQVSNIKYQESSSKHQASSFKHSASSIKHQAKLLFVTLGFLKLTCFWSENEERCFTQIATICLHFPDSCLIERLTFLVFPWFTCYFDVPWKGRIVIVSGMWTRHFCNSRFLFLLKENIQGLFDIALRWEG